MKPVILLIALLAACEQTADSQPASEVARSTPTAQPTPPKAPAKPFVFDEENDLIEFHYGWSAEAAQVPALVKRFQSDLQEVKAKLLKGAKEDKAFRDQEGYDFNPYMSSTNYETAGQSEKLLSLRGDVGDYTGGAHGNHGTKGLLWDRSGARVIQAASLFAEPSNMDRLLTQRWCDALNAEREQRRGEPVADGMFDDCPGFDDLAVIPSDKNRNGRFDNILIVASPYVAGPYAEGMYEIELSVTPDLLAAFKDEYRDDFEADQTQ